MKKVPDRVYLYFAVSLGLAGFIIVLLLMVFRLRTEDQVVGKREVMPAAESATSGHREEEKEEEGSGSKMKRIMKTPAVHAMAFYLAIYVSRVTSSVRSQLIPLGWCRSHSGRMDCELITP